MSSIILTETSMNPIIHIEWNPTEFNYVSRSISESNYILNEWYIIWSLTSSYRMKHLGIQWYSADIEWNMSEFNDVLMILIGTLGNPLIYWWYWMKHEGIHWLVYWRYWMKHEEIHWYSDDMEWNMRESNYI
jgi:hypothetical protein